MLKSSPLNSISFKLKSSHTDSISQPCSQSTLYQQTQWNINKDLESKNPPKDLERNINKPCCCRWSLRCSCWVQPLPPLWSSWKVCSLWKFGFLSSWFLGFYLGFWLWWFMGFYLGFWLWVREMDYNEKAWMRFQF